MLQRTSPIAARRGAEGISERTVRKRFIRNWRARRNGSLLDEVNLCLYIFCFSLCSMGVTGWNGASRNRTDSKRLQGAHFTTKLWPLRVLGAHIFAFFFFVYCKGPL